MQKVDERIKRKSCQYRNGDLENFSIAYVIRNISTVLDLERGAKIDSIDNDVLEVTLRQ